MTNYALIETVAWSNNGAFCIVLKREYLNNKSAEAIEESTTDDKSDVPVLLRIVLVILRPDHLAC